MDGSSNLLESATDSKLTYRHEGRAVRRSGLETSVEPRAKLTTDEL